MYLGSGISVDSDPDLVTFRIIARSRCQVDVDVTARFHRHEHVVLFADYDVGVGRVADVGEENHLVV